MASLIVLPFWAIKTVDYKNKQKQSNFFYVGLIFKLNIELNYSVNKQNISVKTQKISFKYTKI